MRVDPDGRESQERKPACVPIPWQLAVEEWRAAASISGEAREIDLAPQPSSYWISEPVTGAQGTLLSANGD